MSLKEIIGARQEHKKQKELDRLQAEKESSEKQLMQEKKKLEEIKKEKDRLLRLDDKEIQAELILAIRGFYNDYKELSDKVGIIEEKIDELESDISSLNSEVESINSKSENSDTQVPYIE